MKRKSRKLKYKKSIQKVKWIENRKPFSLANYKILTNIHIFGFLIIDPKGENFNTYKIFSFRVKNIFSYQLLITML